jgi:hypothetical protein
MSDFVNTVLTMYKADTSSARTEVKRLRGDEAAAARARLDELEKTNSGIDSQIAKWGKIAAGIGAVIGAYKLAQAAANAALEDMRLESAASGANIDALKSATRGLVEEDKLLEFAGKAMHGVWKLNQSQMEQVLKGAMALRKTMGLELTPTVDALTEAFQRGSSKGLRPLGIEAKTQEEAIQKLGAAYEATGGKVALAGDDFQASNTRIKDSLDNLMGQLGKLVLAMSPVIDAIAALAEGVANLIDRAGTDSNLLSGESASPFLQDMAKTAAIDAEIAKLRKENDSGHKYRVGRGNIIEEVDFDIEANKKRIAQLLYERGQIIAAGNKRQAFEDALTATNQNLDFLLGFSTDANKQKPKGGKPKSKGSDDAWAAYFKNLSGRDWVPADKRAAGDVPAEFMDPVKQIAAGISEMNPAEFTFNEQGGKGLFERIFGDPETIREISLSAELATGALDMMTSSAGSAMDAWITGQQSISEAISSAMAGGLKSLAIMMQQKAIFYAIEGAAALFTAPALAPGLFKVAAMYEAAAIATGVLAKSVMPSSGGGSAGAASNAGSHIGSSRSSDNGDRNITIVLDDAWYGRTRTERAADMARAISQAKRGTPHIRRR